MSSDRDPCSAPMSGQSDYTDAEASRLVEESRLSVDRRAFQKILEYAKAAEIAHQWSPNVALIRSIAELMLTPSPHLRELLVVTCEIEEKPRD